MKAIVELRKVFEETVEVEVPDDLDEIATFDAAEELAWAKAGNWQLKDEEILSVQFED